MAEKHQYFFHSSTSLHQATSYIYPNPAKDFALAAVFYYSSDNHLGDIITNVLVSEFCGR